MLAACSAADSNDQVQVMIETEVMTFHIDTLADGLQNPWGMEFLPDGRILIAERPGRLRVWEDGSLLNEHIEGLPDIWSHGQGGLLDVVMHPDYNENSLIYLVYAARGNEGGGNTAISRARLVFQAYPGIRVNVLSTLDVTRSPFCKPDSHSGEHPKYNRYSSTIH